MEIKMRETIKSQIRREICAFNDTIFNLLQEIDQRLELDKDTFTIIENSNRLWIFCTVKNFEEKKIGNPVCVIYSEDATKDTNTPPVPYGRFFAQYRRVYEKSTGRCCIIHKKESDQFLPKNALWYYKINGHIIFETHDGILGLAKHEFVGLKVA